VSEEYLVGVAVAYSPRKRLRRFPMRGFVRAVEREGELPHLVGMDLACETAYFEYTDPPIEERGLRPCQALEPPYNVGNAVREELLDRPHRREVCPNLIPEALEGICVLSWEDDVTGKEAVPDRVETDGGFPLRRLRSGGVVESVRLISGFRSELKLSPLRARVREETREGRAMPYLFLNIGRGQTGFGAARARIRNALRSRSVAL
jgi:hypothetical protein